MPSFLHEITLNGEVVTIRFRAAAPANLLVVLENDAGSPDCRSWRLLEVAADGQPANPHVVHLAECRMLDDRLSPAAPAHTTMKRRPKPEARVRWEGHEYLFPVRFVDKATLPHALLGRQPTEAELVDYFLLGRVPGEGAPVTPGEQPLDPEGRPVDTSAILAYFMRRFVQALPGVAAELAEAAHSPILLRAAVFGWTSPVALAREAYESLARAQGAHEPRKTPIAVGFQLVEIIAALRRGRDTCDGIAARAIYAEAIAQCRGWLDVLRGRPDLQTPEFRHYCRLFAEGPP